MKNQNKVMTQNLEERANLPSHETAEEETVSPLEKQILIFFVIQKLKNVNVSVFLCAHKCLLISKSVSGRCCLWYGSSSPESVSLVQITPTSPQTEAAAACVERLRSIISRTPCISLSKAAAGLFFLVILMLLGGSKTCGMISEI